MKRFYILFLAALFGTGCYTQVKSSGDYWGYTGRHEREKVVVVPDQVDSSSMYSQDAPNDLNDEQRSRDDEGYSYGDNYYNGYYDVAPSWNYTPAPAISLSFSYGYHRPWWGVGYSSWYPAWYPSYYDPYWDWYYQPGFYSYGCIAPFYGYYDPFYHPFCGFYGGYRHDEFNEGFHDGQRFTESNVRTGRINGGENRGRGNTTSGGGITYGSSARSNSGNIATQNSRSALTGSATNSGRSQQERTFGATAVENTSQTEKAAIQSSGNSASTNARSNPSTQSSSGANTRSSGSSTPSRSNEAPAQQHSAPAQEKTAPAQEHSTPAQTRGGGRSQSMMNAPRNNPRLNQQNGRMSQNYGQRQAMRSSNQGYANAPRGGGGYRSNSNSGGYQGGGGAYRSGGGAAVSRSGGGGSSHSGGGRSK